VISIPVLDAESTETQASSPPEQSELATPPEPDQAVTSAPDIPLTIVEPPAPAEAPVAETGDMPVVSEPADSTEPAESTESAMPDIITIPDPVGDDAASTDASDTDVSGQAGTEESPAPTDYTSPDTFNKVQTDGVVPAPEVDTELVTSTSQDTATEEAAMKAQIDSFINSPETPAEEPAAETSSAMDYAPLESEPAESAPAATETVTPEPAASPAQSSPSVEIPSIISSPIETTENIAPTAAEVTDGTSIVEPQPETLDDFAAPVISTPDGTAAEPVAANEPKPEAETPGSDTTAYDDKLVQDAAQNLAAGSPDEVALEPASDAAGDAGAPKPQSTSRMKIVSPITSNVTKPSIHQLLELEEAKNAAKQAAASTQPASPNVDAYKPSTPEPAPDNKPSIDPNSISL